MLEPTCLILVTDLGAGESAGEQQTRVEDARRSGIRVDSPLDSSLHLANRIPLARRLLDGECASGGMDDVVGAQPCRELFLSMRLSSCFSPRPSSKRADQCAVWPAVGCHGARAPSCDRR